VGLGIVKRYSTIHLLALSISRLSENATPLLHSILSLWLILWCRELNTPTLVLMCRRHCTSPQRRCLALLVLKFCSAKELMSPLKYVHSRYFIQKQSLWRLVWRQSPIVVLKGQTGTNTAVRHLRNVTFNVFFEITFQKNRQQKFSH